MKKLTGLGGIQAVTSLSLGKIENFLHISPKFFPEYTNHGLKHVERVLDIADKLIPNSSPAKLSERDISVLILSICIHDLGMFIERDGLKAILFGDLKKNKTDYLDKSDWNDEWKKYTEQIRRYPERKLKKLYGNSNAVKIPSEDMKDLSDADVLTYGDFLRQYHHRLAHEIAVSGFPGKSKTVLFEGFDKEIVDLIGVIARSHGMNIRDTSDFISTYGADDNSPLGIPVYYLMCIIRLADYLDAGHDRASHIIDNMQEKSSPTSIEEWSWNQVIDYGNYKWTESLASLNIHASPSRSSQFVKIESWLSSVQKELDLSWAILGEYYRNEYELSIRRITSNIMREESRANFDKQFLTKKAAIKANPDIVKLMIEPLYGNEPSFGVRELIQNAVDACNEREHIEKSQGNSKYEGKIEVVVMEKEKLFVIRDNGIGMNSDIIINYFLQAGSSFRQSDLWIKKFTDVRSKSVVRRSGRFGVGFLATFLLGKHMKITTRRVDEDDEDLGYRFELSVDDDVIDVDRVRTEVGTTIEIALDDETVNFFTSSKYNSIGGYNHNLSRSNRLSDTWNRWFYFSKPSVQYYIDNKNVTPKLPPIPHEKQSMEDWFCVEIPGYQNVQWSASSESRTYCNGIIVGTNSCIDKPYNHKTFDAREFSIKAPTVSFIDYDGILPINLQRNSVSYEDSFDFVTQDCYRYFLAELLCAKILPVWTDEYDINPKNIIRNTRHSYSSDNNKWRGKLCDLEVIYGRDGFTLNSMPFLFGANISKILSCEFKYSDNEAIIPWGDTTPMCIKFCTVNNRGRREYPEYRLQESENYSQAAGITSKFVYIPKVAYDDLVNRNKLRKGFMRSIEKDESENYYCLKVKAKNATSIMDLDFIEKAALGEPYIHEYGIDIHDSESFISEMLKEYLGVNGDYWIPYDFNLRKKKFPFAFEALRKYRPNGKMELDKK